MEPDAAKHDAFIWRQYWSLDKVVREKASDCRHQRRCSKRSKRPKAIEPFAGRCKRCYCYKNRQKCQHTQNMELGGSTAPSTILLYGHMFVLHFFTTSYKMHSYVDGKSAALGDQSFVGWSERRPSLGLKFCVGCPTTHQSRSHCALLCSARTGLVLSINTKFPCSGSIKTQRQIIILVVY